MPWNKSFKDRWWSLILPTASTQGLTPPLASVGAPAHQSHLQSSSTFTYSDSLPRVTVLVKMSEYKDVVSCTVLIWTWVSWLGFSLSLFTLWKEIAADINNLRTAISKLLVASSLSAISVSRRFKPNNTKISIIKPNQFVKLRTRLPLHVAHEKFANVAWKFIYWNSFLSVSK